ncbi:hAT family dimerization domain protein [Fusarium oxysporum f. sp. phaseoli]
MIRRAIILRPFIEQLALKHRQQWEQDNRSKRTGNLRKSAREPRICLEENQLTVNDWVVLEHLAKLLGFYEDAVKTLEGDGQQRKRKGGWVGSYGNVWEVIQGFEFLLEVLEDYKQLASEIPDAEHFRINVVRSPVDDEPVAKRQRKYYNPFQAYCERTRPVLGYGLVKEEATLSDDINEDTNELELWQSSWEDGDNDVRDPISYWHERKRQYPRLSRMALDFLTIQPMSAECERMFAAAGRMVTPLRNRLDADIIGMCQVLRSWLRAGVIDDLDVSLLPTENDECIIRYTGRSNETKLVKGKPEPLGFKIWVIAQQGFFIRWLWHIKDAKYGAAGVELPPPTSSAGGRATAARKMPAIEDKPIALNSTQRVVVAVANMLPKATYHVFVDNLFRCLRKHGHGATGKARPNCGIDKE